MIIQMWEGMGLQIIEEIVPHFPFCSYEEFPDCYCGAGDGLGQKIVPDYVYGYTKHLPGCLNISIKLSPACWIHDEDFKHASPTWDAFHACNSRLFANTKTIIEKKSREYPTALRNHALRYPDLYSQSVDAFGRVVFWKIKKEQGYKIPISAAWLLK